MSIQRRRSILGFNTPSTKDLDPDEEWRTAKAPQPEPKALCNVAWSFAALIAVGVIYVAYAPFHNAALLGLGLVGLIACLALVINLPWAVKQFIRR